MLASKIFLATNILTTSAGVSATTYFIHKASEMNSEYKNTYDFLFEKYQKYKYELESLKNWEKFLEYKQQEQDDLIKECNEKEQIRTKDYKSAHCVFSYGGSLLVTQVSNNFKTYFEGRQKELEGELKILKGKLGFK